MRRAIYPGSFDPVTNGHLDVIERAVKLFDEVVVAVAVNSQKQPLFSIEERLDLLTQTTALHGPKVRLARLDGLLVNYAREIGAGAIIRGLRAVSDFEFEFQMALMNRKLESAVETIFLMPKEDYTYLSSRITKEIARLGGDVTTFVPECVVAALRPKIRAGRFFAMKIHLRQIPEDGLHLEGEDERDILEINDYQPVKLVGAVALLARRRQERRGAVGDGRRCPWTSNSSACAAWNRLSTPCKWTTWRCRWNCRELETVDLTPYLREDILLALPAYPHCDWSGERVCPGEQFVGAHPAGGRGWRSQPAGSPLRLGHARPVERFVQPLDRFSFNNRRKDL